MPLLPKEIDILPDGIFSLSYDSHPWNVAHVRSRQEKVLARHLVRHEIAFYLPLMETRRKSGGRQLTSYVPLFPGYVFFRPQPGQRDLVWRSNVAANVIDVPDQELLGRELQQIRQLQLAGASFRTELELAVGDAVQVQEGAFSGYSGVVLREKGRDRLIVQISLIRQAVSVEFERDVVARSK
ncbi:MAG TPA: transcription termination/antitermination NusG family protein [Thermoanaerobaculia bacterium]